MEATTPGNRLLEDLGAAEHAALFPHLQEVTLGRGDVIAEAGEATPYLYFPVDGVLSLVGTTESGSTVEVAVVGDEGMASISAVLGPNTLPFRVVTQVAGKALRLPTEVVSRQLRDCGAFHERLLGYAQSNIAQIAQSAICNRFHNARQRLARWLLMTAERAKTRSLSLTHEEIASMVGGPRSAVTEAAAALRESGAIEYRRGVVIIKSFPKLRDNACECYAANSDAEARKEPNN